MLANMHAPVLILQNRPLVNPMFGFGQPMAGAGSAGSSSASAQPSSDEFRSHPGPNSATPRPVGSLIRPFTNPAASPTLCVHT